MNFTEYINLLKNNSVFLCYSLIGGLIVGIYKIWNHSLQPIEKKLSKNMFLWFLLYCLLIIPFFGVLVSTIHLEKETKMSLLLSLQIGISSPAFINMLLLSVAETIKNNSKVQTELDQ